MREYFDIKRMFAEQIRVCVSMHIDKYLLGMIKPGNVQVVEDAAGDLVATLKACVYAMPRERIVVNEKWPSDWWEALKDRWAPTWFLRRWPVQWKSIDIDKQTYGPVCPHIGSPVRTHLEWMTTTNDATR